jgi:uncharacterized protein (DUF362 family)/Pyruvate/2-oxoacid:ferredoxin oxidoreductase delta subunit
MGSSVSIVKCQTYDEEEVQGQLRQVLRLIGGMKAFVRKGDRVLLKPNLLIGKAPEKAVTTHPSIVRAVIQLVREAGGVPFIGDSPAVGSTTKAAEKAGIRNIAAAMDCPIVEFNRPVSPTEGRTKIFKQLEIDQTVLEADVVINLPKWKTHAQMLLTLGVKNLFGCVSGKQKALWHLKAGEDRQLFAQVLVDIYEIIHPALTILDGVTGMEGNGPGSGPPISLGLILASRDALSLDQVVCDLLQVPRESLMTNRVALERGLGHEQIEVVGERLDAVKVHSFRFPSLSRVDWNLPGFIKRALKNALTGRPMIDEALCKNCQQCSEICPPKVLQPRGKTLSFDYGRCIRCFCCLEVCPEGAVSIQPGWALKLLNRR